jgi:iron-only hydrogenase group A
MVTIEVNGRMIEAEQSEMLLTAIRRVGIHVPTLCHVEGLPPSGACRMCVVEVEGQGSLVPSCAFPVSEGMKVQTHSTRAVQARRTIIELLLADHPEDCFYCERNGNCQLQELAETHGIRSTRYRGEKSQHLRDSSSPAVVRDPAKCILCGKCVRVCDEIQKVGAIEFIGRGSTATVGTAFGEGLNISSCINCGQCITACPTGALIAQSHVQRVLDALNDPTKHVVVQHAPAVSVTLGEEFNLEPGVDVMGLMHAAMRRLKFDGVFDTSWAADLTIMEEASELVHRVKTGGVLPMMTSCSPGWIKFIESFYPDMLPHLSSCKSPAQMLGAVIKSYYAEKNGLEPKDIYSVSVMPCTAKKFEAARPEMGRNGVSDIDAVLTTREFAQLVRMRGLDLSSLEPEPADSPFGQRSTAGKIFGATGGVMEAAIRSAYFFLTGEELGTLKVEAVRGMEGIKEAKLDINGLEVGVAVCNGLGNARTLLDMIKRGEKTDLHFIEVMTCPGGCVGGGGQPYSTDLNRIRARMKSLYTIDATEALRVSHNNADIQRLYNEYLDEPLSEKSHHLLHTHYTAREVLT